MILPATRPARSGGNASATRSELLRVSHADKESRPGPTLLPARRPVSGNDRRRCAKQGCAREDAVAEVISFALSRPRHLVLNEILLRPATQLG